MTQRLSSALRVARETQACVIGSGVLAEVPTLFNDCFGAQEWQPLVVADPRTMAVAGESVKQALGAESMLLDAPQLYAEMVHVETVMARLAQQNRFVPVAVGSGTINDVAKLAAGRLGRPYMVVATAASMDGYSAYGASITAKGLKQTFSCAAPRAIVADLEVMRLAPPEMVAAGYADLLAKVVAGADWLLADAIGVEPLDKVAWGIVQQGLREVLAEPAAIAAGEHGAFGRFVEGLMLGGIAMQRLKQIWPELKMHLREQLLTADEMAQRLRVAGAAVLPEEIGIASGAMAQYARRAMFIRRRFTIFDVAWRLGIPL